jgi:type IV fimbrial biogenesis protein FimT
VLNTFPKSAGFTLIEMMIVVAIVVVAVSLGIPNYREWVQNTQVRNAAESAVNGLQKAKAEAVKQNTNIEFVLGSSGATHPWVIQIPAAASAPASAVESANTEGSKNVLSTPTPAPVPPKLATVTFNSLGGVGVPPNTPNNTDGSAPISQIDFAIDATSVAPAGNRPLRITIGIGGNVRLCDPSSKLSATDPRKC